MSITPIYEKDLSNSVNGFDMISLNEFTGSTPYSGTSMVLNYSNFSQHFDTTGHTYSNVILNNDMFTFTGLTGETHYYTITNFYTGVAPYIHPLLTGFTEAELISGFTTDILHCPALQIYSGNCCPVEQLLNLPWVVITNEGAGVDNCTEYLHRRVHKGWVLDYIFNRNNIAWTNAPFFYTGVRDEYNPEYYGDNNLSFQFTSDRRIKWTSYRYSGYCDTVSGYTPVYYISTGQTVPLCSNGTSSDFAVSIVFDRYYEYSGCSLANEGGWNDLINTGLTSTTGSTIVVDYPIEKLSQKWINERKKRLGTLKIFHNGRPVAIDVPLSPIPNFRNLPVYKVIDFEEIVLSDRGFQPFTHIQGGGTTGSGGLHTGLFPYTIKYAAYFEEPMSTMEIRQRYEGRKSEYNIIECSSVCVDNLVNIVPSPTPSSSVSPTPSVTPSPTPSITTSVTITPSTSIITTPSITPSPTVSTSAILPTPSITPSVTPSPGFLNNFSWNPPDGATTLTIGPDQYYYNLTAAINDINAGTFIGDIVLQIVQSTVEDPAQSPAILYESGHDGLSSYTSVHIYPVNPNLTVSGKTSDPILIINGVNNVTIDGRVNKTGNIPNLTFINDGVTIQFSGAPSYNTTVVYCNGVDENNVLWSPNPSAQTYTVGATGDSATLSEAFGALIAYGAPLGDVVLQITSSFEDTAGVFYAEGTNGTTWNSIIIYPVVSGLTISANVLNYLYTIDGSVNITIDGRVNRTGNIPSLTISNTYPNAEINFINSPKNCEVIYCNFE